MCLSDVYSFDMVVCCLLIAVRWLSCDVRYVLFGVCLLMLPVRCFLFVVCHALLVVWYVLLWVRN